MAKQTNLHKARRDTNIRNEAILVKPVSCLFSTALNQYPILPAFNFKGGFLSEKSEILLIFLTKIHL